MIIAATKLIGNKLYTLINDSLVVYLISPSKERKFSSLDEALHFLKKKQEEYDRST